MFCWCLFLYFSAFRKILAFEAPLFINRRKMVQLWSTFQAPMRFKESNFHLRIVRCNPIMYRAFAYGIDTNKSLIFFKHKLSLSWWNGIHNLWENALTSWAPLPEINNGDRTGEGESRKIICFTKKIFLQELRKTAEMVINYIRSTKNMTQCIKSYYIK